MNRSIGPGRLISTVVLIVGLAASLATIADYLQKRQNKDRPHTAPSTQVTPSPNPPAPILDGFTPAPVPSNQAAIVYRTPSGERYHRVTCRSVKGKAIPLSLSEAKDLGLTPCKVCRPPSRPTY